MSKPEIVVVTGASAGLGRAIVRVFPVSQVDCRLFPLF